MRKVCLRAQKNKFVYGGFLSHAKLKDFRCRHDSARVLSNADDSEKLCNLIKCSFPYNKHLHILDACAGVGGDTIQFHASGFFKSIVAVELDALNYVDLQHNVNQTQRLCQSSTSIECLLTSCLDILPVHRQNVVYLDVPWIESDVQGGRLQLMLGKEKIQDVLARMTNSLPEVYILKIPKNWCHLQRNEIELDWCTQVYYGRKFNWCFLWCLSRTGSVRHRKVE